MAKPFVGALSGHLDGVYCMAKDSGSLAAVLSGSADGEIRLWDLSSRRCVWKTTAHNAFVKGVCFVGRDGPASQFLSCSDDHTVKLWSSEASALLTTFEADCIFSGIDCQYGEEEFITAGGDAVQLWNVSRRSPIHTFSWGTDIINHVRYNPSEKNIFASTSSDRCITIYDVRLESPLSKVCLKMKSNALCWNPMEPYYFSVANEDHNCYTFDMRFLDGATGVMKDHAAAVIDLDYSPTGQELVTGSYDKTLRIFNCRESRSRELYHTSRMQRLFCVRYTMDGRFVLSGSDEGNIRIWRSNSSRKLGVLTPRERNSLNYADHLKEKYRDMPEVRRILKHRHVPKVVAAITKTKNSQQEALAKREENQRKHTPNTAPPAAQERKQAVVKVHS